MWPCVCSVNTTTGDVDHSRHQPPPVVQGSSRFDMMNYYESSLAASLDLASRVAQGDQSSVTRFWRMGERQWAILSGIRSAVWPLCMHAWWLVVAQEVIPFCPPCRRSGMSQTLGMNGLSDEALRTHMWPYVCLENDC